MKTQENVKHITVSPENLQEYLDNGWEILYGSLDAESFELYKKT